MNINFDKIGDSVKRFALENAGEFLGAIAMAAVYSFCKNHGINMRPPTVFDAYCDSSTGQRNVQLAIPFPEAVACYKTFSAKAI